MSLSQNKKLLTAVSNNRIDEAKECLDQGANIHALGPNQLTALSVACGKGYLDMVRLLVNYYDANVHANGGPDNLPGYAFIRACHFNFSFELCEFLVAKANLSTYAGYVMQKMVMKPPTKGSKGEEGQNLFLDELREVNKNGSVRLAAFRKAVKLPTSGVRKTLEVFFTGKPDGRVVDLLLRTRSHLMTNYFKRIRQEMLHIQQFQRKRKEASYADISKKIREAKLTMHFPGKFREDEKENEGLDQPPKPALLEKCLKDLKKMQQFLIHLRQKFTTHQLLYSLALTEWTLQLICMYEIDLCVYKYSAGVTQKTRLTETKMRVRAHITKHHLDVSKAMNYIIYDLLELHTPPPYAVPAPVSK